MSFVASRLMEWGKGRGISDSAGARTVVLESAEHVPEVRRAGLLGPDSVVFARGATTGDDVVGYKGSFRDWDGEVSVGDDFFLQTQRYAVTPFLSVVGPTLVRITDVDDFDAFLHDADTAWNTGVFAEHAMHPLLQWADVPALGSGADSDGPALRLFISSAGEVSTSPCGRRIGWLGDDVDGLVSTWGAVNSASDAPCSVCLARAVPEPVRADALARRPWLARYLEVLDALREGKARGWGATTVGGFGDQFGHGSGAVVLLHHDGVTHLHDPATGRTFKVGADASVVAEALLSTGSKSAAVLEVARRLHIDQTSAREALEAVVARIGGVAREGSVA